MTKQPKRIHLPVVQRDEVYEQNYATRKQLADEAHAELRAAIAACGPDAEAYGAWTIHDKLGLEPPRRFYTCRRPEHVGWQPRPPDFDERIEQDVVTVTTLGGVKYETHSLEIGGVKYFPFRYSTYFGALSEYKPRTAEQMKAAAEARRAKAIAKQEQIDDEAEREQAERKRIQPELPF